MSKKDWICVALIILGILLFLAGANNYGSLVGWLGVFLFVGGVVALIIIYTYNILSKGTNPAGSSQNP